MEKQSNVSLKPFTTFRLTSQASHFVTISSRDDILSFVHDPVYEGVPRCVLGGGSNILFVGDFEGVVLHNQIKGISKVASIGNEVMFEISAGEVWHDFVMFTASEGLSGIENLALIPGSVGGAAVQNIAAYGQNLEDVFVSLDAMSLDTGQLRTFSKDECGFDYRYSVFKDELKNAYIITSVRLNLSKTVENNYDYFSVGGRNDSLVGELEKQAEEPYTPLDVARAVSAIRSRKLIDPARAPTVGSFFVNPVVSKDTYLTLKKDDPDLQWYPLDKLQYPDNTAEVPEQVKVPVGRLLDTLGWRGRSIGNVSISAQWASIITHNGNATGEEILAFVETVKNDVKTQYGIELKSEVSIIGEP